MNSITSSGPPPQHFLDPEPPTERTGSMFQLSFTKRDAIRSVYAFLFAALGYLVIVQPADLASWKAAAIGAVAAGAAAVKNLLLADGSTLKG